MSARMQFPLSQRRHTNIAVVRYTKSGVKLEIACYKNKVVSYRSGTEDRLDEVLQVERVFTSVARGHIASDKEIQAVFGNDVTEQEAIKFMLDHGELQVAQQERTAEVDVMFKDIALIIAEKCVNTKTQRPFPAQVIEQALRSAGAAVKLDQPVKKQALGFIHLLMESDIIPIARANMKLRCVTSTDAAVDKIVQWCEKNGAEATRDAPGSGPTPLSLVIVMQPHLFRELNTIVSEQLPSGSSLHMLEAAVMEVGEGGAAASAPSGARMPSDEEDDDDDRAKGAERAPTAPGAAGKGKRQKGKKGKGGRQEEDDEDEDDDGSDQEDAAPAPVKGPQGGGGKGGKKKKNKKGRRGGDDSSDDDDDGPSFPQGPGAINDLSAELQKLGLDPIHDLNDSDDDDDGGRRGKGKKGKGKKK